MYSLIVKKFIPLFSIAIIVVVYFSNASSVAFAASNAQYALMYGDTPFYAVSGDGYDVIAYLPSSYYVTVEGSQGLYYRVSYGDLTGYVRQSAVSLVDYEPVTKYAYGYAALKSGIASVYLYESSDLARISGAIGTDTDMAVYGYIDSGVLSYYCRIKIDNTFIRGYVPPTGIDIAMPAKNDGSRIEPEPEPETGTPAGGSPEGKEPPSSYILQIVLVVVLVVPSVLAVLLIFSGKKREEEGGEPPPAY